MPRPGRELEATTRAHERVGNIIEDSATPAGFLGETASEASDSENLGRASQSVADATQKASLCGLALIGLLLVGRAVYFWSVLPINAPAA